MTDPCLNTRVVGEEGNGVVHVVVVDHAEATQALVVVGGRGELDSVSHIIYIFIYEVVGRHNGYVGPEQPKPVWISPRYSRHTFSTEPTAFSGVGGGRWREEDLGNKFRNTRIDSLLLNASFCELFKWKNRTDHFRDHRIANSRS
jgi:hypothetical protein